MSDDAHGHKYSIFWQVIKLYSVIRINHKYLIVQNTLLRQAYGDFFQKATVHCATNLLDVESEVVFYFGMKAVARMLKLCWKFVCRAFWYGWFTLVVLVFHGVWMVEFGSHISNPPEVERVALADGGIAEFDMVTGLYLPSDFGRAMPEVAIRCEDRKFFNDHAYLYGRFGEFDLPGTSKGVLSALIGEGLNGGSTFGQQLTRCENPWISDPEKEASASGSKAGFWLAAFSRKFAEIGFGNAAVESRGRATVLRDYLRTVPAGSIGVETTALREFGKKAAELNEEEAAIVTATFPKPVRTRNRKEWQKHASNRNPAAVLAPAAFSLSTFHPMASVLAAKDSRHFLSAEAQIEIFMACRKFLLNHPEFDDVHAIVEMGDVDSPITCGLVDTAKGGLGSRVWGWSNYGKVRMNSTIKPFWADPLFSFATISKSEISTALEDSNNDFFLRYAPLLGEEYLSPALRSVGIWDATGYSVLGRVYVNPTQLLRGLSKIVERNSGVRRALREVPRRGTAAGVLRHFPTMPRDCWAKTASSPGYNGVMIVGGTAEIRLLISADARNGANNKEAGLVLAPLFAEILGLSINHQKTK